MSDANVEHPTGAAASPSSQPPVPDEPQSIRFRLVHVFYVMAVVASSVALTGPVGLVLAAVVIAIWASIFNSPLRRLGFAVSVIIPLGIIALLLFALLPAMQTAREAARRMQCSSHLKQITLALHIYHDRHGAFPPRYLADTNGKPMHSWRVLILPYIDEMALYGSYNFDEPWNSPANAKLAGSMPYMYRCPSKHDATGQTATHTGYQAVAGSGTLWPGGRGVALTEVRDGTSNTIALVESHTPGVHWMEPKDLEMDQAITLLSDEGLNSWNAVHTWRTFFYEYQRGISVAMADGSLDAAHARSRASARSALTIDAGDAADGNLSHDLSARKGRPRYGNWYRLGLWILIVLLPTPWAYRRARSESRALGRV